MTNKGKTYKDRGGLPPRLRQALEVAWAGYQAALLSKGKQRLPTPDEWFIQATLIGEKQHQDRVKARQGYAPVESGTVTRGTVTGEG